MTSGKTTLVAVYDNYETAQQAQSDLIQSGFSKQDVQVQSNDSSRTMTASSAGYAETTEHHHEGGISGFFRNLFGGNDQDDHHDHEGRYYADAVTGGKSVLTASIDDAKVDSATNILNKYNPIDIDTQTSATQPDTAWRDGTSDKVSDERVIPVVQEELQVGKRAVQRGGVRVYSRVTEQPVSENITLHDERATVERRTVNRPATDADYRMDNEVIEVMETSEEAVVGKTARVVEEVVVGRKSSDRTENISDTVRRTDVEVEKISPEVERDFRSDYTTRYAGQGDYDTYEPAYGYGYGLNNDPKYAGRDWNDIESSAKSDYLGRNPNSAWDKVSNAVRFGWDRSRQKVSQAANRETVNR